MAWRLDLVAHAKLTFDCDQAGQNSRTMLAFKAALCTQPRDLVTEPANFCGNLARPAVRNASRSTGIWAGATPPGAVARKLWNGFNAHLLP
jgi:hypothetical protein